MLNFDTFLLWTLAACFLWRGSLAEDLQSQYVCLLDDPSPNQCDSFCLTELRPLLKQVIKGQGQGITCDANNETKAKLGRLMNQQARLRSQFQGVEAKLEGRLQEVKTKMQGQLQDMQARLHGVEAKLEGQLQEVKVEMKGVEAKLVGRLEEVQAKLEAKLEGQQTVLTRMAESLAKLEGNLPAVQTSLETKPQTTVNRMENQNPLQAVSTTTEANVNLPSEIEKIGTRYFKIVYEKANWITAERKCRETGGYLAAFRNEEEFNAIKEKVEWKRSYWLGLNDRDSEGHFVSVASNKPAQFFKWGPIQPDNKNNNQNCVALFIGSMWDDGCDIYRYYICQSDNEI
ncbi:hypothetical protein KR054_012273 [Drosophila jambulina]|nr:hypothetical protein KR054_012273 [Drosophila jambulina]